METQFVEFTEPVGSWPAGHIEQMRSAVAQGYITAGQAKASDAISHVRASLIADSEKRHAAFEERILGVVNKIGASATPPKPPGSNGGVDFTTLSNGTRAADEVKNLCLSDAMRCLFLTHCRDVDPGLANFGRERLQRHYVSEVRKYETDVNSGEIRETIERSMPNGGMTTITRDGTDSLSGGATYGFTLKPNFIGDLFVIPLGQQVFAPACEMVPMTQGNETRWPALGQFTTPKVVNGIPMPAGLGGVAVYFKSETAPRTASDLTTRLIDFKAEDATALTKFSRDYIVDNYIAMNQKITERIGLALGTTKDWCTMFGSGIGMPEGFTNSKAFIQVDRAANSDIRYADVLQMMSQMAAGCLTTSRWITNQTTMPKLASISDGTNRVFLPNSLVTQADFPSFVGKTPKEYDRNTSRLMGTLMGLPVYFSEYVPQLGLGNELMLVCPSQYGLAQRSGVEVMVTDQFYWDTDEIGYKFKERYDGRSLWPSPYIQADNLGTPASGTQVSPFIGLSATHT